MKVQLAIVVQGILKDRRHRLAVELGKTGEGEFLAVLQLELQCPGPGRLEESRKVFKLNNIPTIDVTRKSVEETAASIIKMIKKTVS